MADAQVVSEVEVATFRLGVAADLIGDLLERLADIVADQPSALALDELARVRCLLRTAIDRSAPPG